VGSIVLSPLTLVLLETGKQTAKDVPALQHTVRSISKSILKPIVLAPIIGMVFSLADVDLTHLLASSLTLIGGRTIDVVSSFVSARLAGAERTLDVLGGVGMNAAIRFDGQVDSWSRRRAKKAARLARVAPWMKGHVLETGATVEALQALIEPGDAVALEGDNQKQADFLSRALAQVDPAKTHDLHLLISSVSRPEHLTLFERGIARKLDLA
jgi:Malonate decarboxylase, alpha subunit, transporter